jgi:hypothetical protein
MHMRNLFSARISLGVFGAALFLAGWLVGQRTATTEKTTVHAAAWTARDGLTQQEFEAFKKETAAMVGAVPGLKRVWTGKLRAPVTFDGVKRDYGIVLEFDSVKSKQAYSDKHPSPWYEDFAKIRQPGSSNFDVVGE